MSSLEAQESIFGIRYIEAAIKGLEAARISNKKGKGLFSATEFEPSKCRVKITQGDSQENDENYSLSWVRDTLKASIYDLVAGKQECAKETIKVLISYFKQEQNAAVMEATIQAHGRGEKLKFDKHVILPRMHPLTLQPVHADQQKDLQLDMAEFLKNLALANYKGTSEEISVVRKFIKYCKAWNYGLNGEFPGDFGIWEEGLGGTQGRLRPVLHASSIAAVLSGYMHIRSWANESKDPQLCALANLIDEKMISEGLYLLNNRIRQYGETEERPYDLTSLIVLYDHLVLAEKKRGKLLEDDNVEKILAILKEKKLERARGFVRYASESNLDRLDDYHKSESDGGYSAEWTMGFCYAALIYAKLGKLKQAFEYVLKAESVFDFSKGMGLPEAYFGNTDKPVNVNPLTWSNALYLTAYETMRKMVIDGHFSN